MAAGTQSTGAPSKTLNVYFVYVFFVLERGLRKGVFYIHDCITGTIYI